MGRGLQVVGALVLAGLVLIGCGGSGKPASTSSSTMPTSTTTIVTTTTTTTTPAPPTPEEQFVNAVRADREIVDAAETFLFDPATDQDLLAKGIEACNEARVGVPEYQRSPEEVLVETWEVTKQPLKWPGRTVVLAARFLCPDVQPLLDALLADPPAPVVQISGGTHAVPSVMPHGVYEARDLEGCYWETRDSVGQMVENDFITGAIDYQVTIRPGVASFTTEGCGTWRKVG